jgi:2-oxo-4-hydroxy-4-carboxy--5-ureidoimidazoline (OHCU) decarboxylase
MLMSTMEGEELGRLKTGEAFICPERYHRPRRITTVNLHAQYDFSSDVVNERILPYIREDSWFRQAALQRTINELAELKDRMDSFDNRRLRLIPEMASLLARQSRIMAHSRSGDRSKGMAELRDTAYRLKKRLSDAYRSFLRNSYRRYLRLDAGCEAQDALLEEMRKNLVNRFESITKPDVEKCLEVFGEFIRRCGPA